jgi:hypothetical protein
MSAQPKTASTTRRHAGPHLELLAIASTVLFNAGLSGVSAFGIPFGVKQPSDASTIAANMADNSSLKAHLKGCPCMLACSCLDPASRLPTRIYQDVDANR